MRFLFGKKKSKDTEDAGLAALQDKRRQLTGNMLLFLNVICVVMSVYQLYIAAFGGDIIANVQRALHLMFGLSICFLLYPATSSGDKSKVPFYDLVLGALGVAANLYIIVFFKEISLRAGMLTTADYVFGLILIVVLLECSRRVVGPVLTGIAVFFLIYCLFGRYFPGDLAHRGVSLKGLVRHMYLTTEGVYGTILGVSTSFIFLFILMGAILSRMGTGAFLIDISLALFGKQRGGPAKAAVLACALFGMINGSTVANIVTTGTFAVPLMKRVGYKNNFIGAIEAAASVGGQIMPPVMGAAAFIIAENLGVSYLTVCLAAALPATLYFLAILFSVHQESVRQGIQGLPPEEIPNMRQVLQTRGYLILPLLIIIAMLIFGFSPAMAGFSAVISAILLSYLKPESRLTPKKLFEAFAAGAKGAMEVLIACAVVGFIIGSFTLSGLGLKLAGLVVAAGGGYLFLTLVFTAIACILLGMGVPTTANYVMMSMITVPAVIEMGVPIMAAHMFCFYYGIISDLTPPVALGSLAGAGIAGGQFWPTAFEATKLGVAAYVVPFFFVYNPILLLSPDSFSVELLVILPFTVFGIRLLSSALYNYLITDMKPWERTAVLAASLLCIHPDILWSFIGLSLAAGVYFLQKKRVGKAVSA